MRLRKAVSCFMAVVLFLSVAAGNAKASLSESDIARIDTYISTQLREANIPGAALAVIEKGKVIHVKGFGVSGLDGRPITGESGFIIGSTTKSFTALAIMQLVEAGKVELDAPIQKYITLQKLFITQKKEQL